MATPVIVNDIVQVIAYCTMPGQTALNVVNYRVKAAGAPPSTDQDICDFLSGQIAPHYKLAINNSAVFYGVSARLILRVPLLPIVAQNVDQGPGTGGATPLSDQTCGIVRWHTQFAGRKYRGRIYVPFPSSAMIDASGHPNNAYGVLLGGIILGWAPQVDTNVAIGGRTSTIRGIVFHRQSHLFDDVTGTVISPKWGTQKRRGDYGRANTPPF